MTYEKEIRDTFSKEAELLDRLPEDADDLAEIKARLAALSNAVEESFLILSRQISGDETAGFIGLKQ